MVILLLTTLALAQTPAQRASALLDEGIALSQQGRFPEAGDKFVHALSLDPANAEAHYLLGLVRQEAGRTDAALASFRSALKLHPAYGAALARICELETVFARASEGGYAQALATCRRAFALIPEDPEPHFHAGWNLARMGDFAGAIQQFGAVLKMDPKYPNARFELAMAYVDAQNLPRAIPLLKEVAAAEPENGNVRFQLGAALAKQGDCEQAIPLLEAAPEAAEKYYILGGCYRKLGRASDASVALDKVKALREDSGARMRAKFLAATAHRKGQAGDLAGAISDYRQSLALREDATVRIDLAVTLLKQGEAAEVLTLLTPDAGPLARYQMALAHQKLGRTAEAVAALEAAVLAKPDFAEAWYQLGVLRMSESALATAVRLRPDEAAFRLAWAEALERDGKREQARQQRELAARLRAIR